MMRLAALFGLGFLLSVAPAGAAPKVKDQTVATWPKDNKTPAQPFRVEYSIVVRGGVLEEQGVTYSQLYPQGSKETRSIKLSNVKAFEANEFENDDRSKVYRIAIEARGAKDFVEKARSGTCRSQGMPGYAVFSSDQHALRDEIYKKLCDLIGQTP